MGPLAWFLLALSHGTDAVELPPLTLEVAARLEAPLPERHRIQEPVEEVTESAQADASQGEGEEELDPDERWVRAWAGTGEGETWSLARNNYAAVGPDDLKLQLSFKYRAFRESDFYVAFTSRIVWDVWERSLPYRDITFQPEFFYRWIPQPGVPYSLDMGYWHNSNGKDGSESRAWDRLYIRAVFRGELLGREYFVVPSGYLTVYASDKNDDIEDYLGYWDVSFLWRRLVDPGEENLDLLVNLVGGEDGIPFDRGSLEVGAFYRLKGSDFNPRLFAQFFTGYGNTLVEYYDHETTFRVGLAF
jgi:outer membrane phospholipase A